MLAAKSPAVEVTEPVRIEVAAAAACITTESFLNHVRVRSPSARQARDGEQAPTYRVTIAAPEGSAGSAVTGVVVADDGEPRTLTGASCSEVAEALAITVALSIRSRSPAIPVEPPATAAPAVAPAPPAAIVGLVGQPLPDVRAKASPRWRFGVGFDASAASMGALTTLFAPGVFAEAGPVSDTPDRFALASRVRLSGATFGGALETGAGRADFRWWAARLDECPLAARIVPGVVFRPCAGMELGGLFASGGGVSRATSSERAWVAARGLVTVTWSPSKSLFFQGIGGVSVPITRSRFLFAPSDVVFQPPSIGPFAGLGAGMTFP